MLDDVAKIVGILGFFMSIVNFANIYRQNRVKIKVDNVVTTSYLGMIIFDVLVSNGSSLSISFVNVSLTEEGCKEPVSCYRFAYRIRREYRENLNDKEMKTEFREIPAQLPINLGPYEARRIFLLFPLHESAYKTLHGTPERSPRQEECTVNAGRKTYKLHFHTPRKRVLLETCAEEMDYYIWEKEIGKALWRSVQ